MEWIIGNIPTVVVCLVVVVGIFFAIKKIVKGNRSGNRCCGDCARCTSDCSEAPKK